MNKGQSLVIFVIILPIIVTLFYGIYEIGNLGYTLNKDRNEIKDTIKYGLKHDSSVEDLKTLIQTNIGGEVTIEKTDYIKIDYENEYQGLIKEIKLSYTGYIENGKIIIKENKK